MTHSHVIRFIYMCHDPFIRAMTPLNDVTHCNTLIHLLIYINLPITYNGLSLSFFLSFFSLEVSLSRVPRFYSQVSWGVSVSARLLWLIYAYIHHTCISHLHSHPHSLPHPHPHTCIHQTLLILLSLLLSWEEKVHVPGKSKKENLYQESICTRFYTFWLCLLLSFLKSCRPTPWFSSSQTLVFEHAGVELLPFLVMQ